MAPCRKTPRVTLRYAALPSFLRRPPQHRPPAWRPTKAHRSALTAATTTLQQRSTCRLLADHGGPASSAGFIRAPAESSGMTPPYVTALERSRTAARDVTAGPRGGRGCLAPGLWGARGGGCGARAGRSARAGLGAVLPAGGSGGERCAWPGLAWPLPGRRPQGRSLERRVAALC